MAQTKLSFAFLDSFPVSNGHALVMPKRHVESIWKMTTEEYMDASNLVRQVKEKFGRVDILVNNAGITRDKLLLRMSEKDWDDVIDTNLKGAFNLSKPVVAAMVSQRSGAILNITSISGIVGMPGQVNYSSSKAGMIGFTKALAKEVAKANITVNALALVLSKRI